MKTISILKNAAQSILLAGMMLGIAGVVQAQVGITGETGGRGETFGKSGAMEGSGLDSSLAGPSSSGELGRAITGQEGVPPAMLPISPAGLPEKTDPLPSVSSSIQPGISSTGGSLGVSPPSFEDLGIPGGPVGGGSISPAELDIPGEALGMGSASPPELGIPGGALGMGSASPPELGVPGAGGGSLGVGPASP